MSSRPSAALPLLLLLSFLLLPFCSCQSSSCQSYDSACQWASCPSDQYCTGCSLDSSGFATPDCHSRDTTPGGLSALAIFGVISGAMCLLCCATVLVKLYCFRRMFGRQTLPVQMQMAPPAGSTAALALLMYSQPGYAQQGQLQAAPPAYWQQQQPPQPWGPQAVQGQWSMPTAMAAPPPPYAGVAYSLPPSGGPYVAAEGVQRAPQTGVAWTEVQKPQAEAAAQVV